MPSLIKRNWQKFVFALFFLLAGFGLAWAGKRSNFLNLSNLFCANSKSYIDWRLRCGYSPIVNKSSYGKLKGELVSLIQTKMSEGSVVGVSIYFRDLQSGPTLGINEHDKFVPASLLKLPLLITYLDLAEDIPELLERKLAFHLPEGEALESSFHQDTEIAEPLKENTPYTIDYLLRQMIIYSDNRAYFGLGQYLNKLSPGKDLAKQTLDSLGVIDPNNPLDDTLTVKSYSSIFFQLYSSSYFSHNETSEKALSLLAQSVFNEGLRKGIPTGLTVAHKFGERSDAEGYLKQLHDCGIIYYPGNPYLLCVMTRGTDWQKLSDFIGLVSKMFYEEFDSRKL